MVVINKDCISCGQCEEYCPVGAIVTKDTDNPKAYAQYTINQDICTQCEACLECNCPGNAIRIKQ